MQHMQSMVKTSDRVLLHQGGNRQEEEGDHGQKRYEPVLGKEMILQQKNMTILHG